MAMRPSPTAASIASSALTWGGLLDDPNGHLLLAWLQEHLTDELQGGLGCCGCRSA